MEAVRQLCDGKPTPETETFLRSLSPELPLDGEPVTRLHRDNFVVNYVNDTELKKLPRRVYQFKATVKGIIVNFVL